MKGVIEMQTTNGADATATLYTVTSPRNTFYAVRAHATGMIWSERTESAAKALAAEQGLRVGDEQEITQAELRELIAAHERRTEDASAGSHPGQDQTTEPSRHHAPAWRPSPPPVAVGSSVLQRFVQKVLGRTGQPGTSYTDRKG